MTDLREQISSVTTRQPIDGTGSGDLTKPRVAKLLERSRTEGPAVARTWKCPGCGSSTNDASEYARHMTLEFVSLRDRVDQVTAFLAMDGIREHQQPVHLRNLINTTQAAQMLDVSTRYICKVAKTGRLNGRLVGSNWFFDRQDVEAFQLLRRQTGWDRAASPTGCATSVEATAHAR